MKTKIFVLIGSMMVFFAISNLMAVVWQCLCCGLSQKGVLLIALCLAIFVVGSWIITHSWGNVIRLVVILTTTAFSTVGIFFTLFVFAQSKSIMAMVFWVILISLMTAYLCRRIHGHWNRQEERRFLSYFFSDRRRIKISAQDVVGTSTRLFGDKAGKRAERLERVCDAGVISLPKRSVS